MPRRKKTEAKEVVDTKMDIDTEPEVVETPAESVEEVKTKKARVKRTFRLHGWAPDGRPVPKGGGKYCSSTPSLAARKAANRWVCPKKEFDTVYEFSMREVGRKNREGKPVIYQFKAKRVKLANPKTYSRGEREITVDSKIVLCE